MSEPGKQALDGRSPREACERFVEAHYREVYRFFLWMTRDPEASSDLTQDTFAAFWTSTGDRGLGAVPDPKAWLYGIARNRWRKRCRDRREWAALEEAVELEDQAPGPELSALQALDQAEVTRAVTDLPPEYREALVLRVFQELGYAQIAEVIGTSEGLARWRVHRARLLLRAALLSGGEEPAGAGAIEPPLTTNKETTGAPST